MNTIRKTRGTHMLLVLLGVMSVLFACEEASSSSDDSGSSTTDISTLMLSYDAIEGVENLAITETGPTWDTDTEPTATYAVTGSLPDGLVIDTDTGIISGTPTTIQDAQDYTITATGTGSYTGTQTATVSITVVMEVFIRWIESDSYKAITDTTTGTPIGTAEELKNIANDLAGEYYLTTHIDISEEEWVPLGSFTSPFTGMLHGNGHIIYGLTIDAAAADSDNGNYQGLFASINNAVVEDVGIGVVHIRAEALTGAVAGSAEGTSKIENVAVAGMDDTAVLSTRGAGVTVASATCAFLGGLVGINTAEAEISDGYNLGILTESEGGGTTSASCTGGLAGLNQGTVHGYLYTESDNDSIVVKGKTRVGGLVGENAVNSEVRGVFSGARIIEGINYVGGLVGRNRGSSVVKGYVAGSTVKGQEEIGGLVGRDDVVGRISGYTTGVTVTGTKFVGGLVGITLRGVISGSVADGTVTATGDFAGGLVGQESGSSISGYVTSTVEGANYVGGLLGNNSTGTSKAVGYVTNKVTGTGQETGVLFGGVSSLTAEGCYWDVAATGYTAIGGNRGITAIANVVYDSGTGTYRDSRSTDYDFVDTETEVFNDASFLTQFDLPGASATWPELKPYRVLPFGALTVGQKRDIFAVGPWSETNAVTWKSSDATKVAVDAVTGQITAVEATTPNNPVIITATWDGNPVKTATVDITVRSAQK